MVVDKMFMGGRGNSKNDDYSQKGPLDQPKLFLIVSRFFSV